MYFVPIKYYHFPYEPTSCSHPALPKKLAVYLSNINSYNRFFLIHCKGWRGFGTNVAKLSYYMKAVKEPSFRCSFFQKCAQSITSSLKKRGRDQMITNLKKMFCVMSTYMHILSDGSHKLYRLYNIKLSFSTWDFMKL